MASAEAYMLSRDQEESQRLNTQHQFMRQLANGKLVQPSVPLTEVRAIADVATGTGIWIQEVAHEIGTANNDMDLVGFDISSQQYPKNGINDVDLVVHDVTKPFPKEHHGRFDLVNVRLLSYALESKDLQTAVKNIVDILRPGGYLQWQEIDAIDSWARPQTPNARSTIVCIISERMARGLTPAFVIRLASGKDIADQP
ncbi:MAG: hypothetical protein OHK93_002710 [Ramalina farinacea]|uniref:Methyltransferase domain-containing protein n=1 Tax=Ramalina farinacea TaxID=258253 RepID=A0AA43QUJ8_9LECA|nr:hypothetical protein [Ramalina farinacea]